ncbi:trace amine-associated receptor 13c-like [Branchiostoma floridae]|uniref:Trace amine-associated receptor 13c-like n=1 Tax=Branchiostoma floridae TaxID=7739 RepID=A0A9J7LPK4_BRAFL|nr:trace amine-associated receptor 13c-like [Branchiostoma floridae]
MKNTTVAMITAVAAVTRIMENTSENPGVCGFVTRNITSGNVVTSVTSYDPAPCGLYGNYPASQPVLIFILVIMTAWSLFGNGCLLYLVFTEKNMREAGNIFLCALALADMAQILVYAPPTVYNLVHGEILGEGWCRVQAFLMKFLPVLSIYLQTSLWICRFIYIAFPLDYASIMTKRRLAVAMAACLLIALVTPVVGLARVGTVQSWTVDEYPGAVDIAQPISLMLSCLSGGAEVDSMMALISVGLTISFITACLIYKVAWDSGKNQEKLTGIAKDQLKHKLAAAKTLGIIFGVQLITWLPSTINTFLWKTGVIAPNKGVIAADIFFIVTMTSTFLVFANSKNIYRRALTSMYYNIRKIIQWVGEIEIIPLVMLRMRRPESNSRPDPVRKPIQPIIEYETTV